MHSLIKSRPSRIKAFAIRTLVILLAAVYGFGCSQSSKLTSPSPQNAPTGTAAPSDSGTLRFLANGEDFVRRGLRTKDGWQLKFDHAYVTLADITAYQLESPFTLEDGIQTDNLQEELLSKSNVTISLDEAHRVDLATGDETADPVLIGTKRGPSGQYNALSWTLVSAETNSGQNSSLLLRGKASKNNQEVDFSLNFNHPLRFVCGDYVGDERKGIVRPKGEADVEATFHLDHLFGDAEVSLDDEINTGGLGFEPFARFVRDGVVSVDMPALQQNFSKEDYDKLLSILANLGHVGEGHCKAIASSN